MKRHDAGEVQPLLALGHRAADDDVLDIGVIQPRHALEAARSTARPRSSARVSARLPFFALPTAVLTADTITASRGFREALMDGFPPFRGWLE